MNLDSIEIKYEEFKKLPSDLIIEIATILFRMEGLGMELSPGEATTANHLKRLVREYRVNLLNHCASL